jgi:hypothetical protein
MGSPYLYVSAFFSHWWPLVSAGSLLGVEEFAERYWPWARKWLLKIPGRWRKGATVGALVIASFYSGYLAWSDEHEKVSSMQQEMATHPNQQAQINLLTDEINILRDQLNKKDARRHLTDEQKRQLKINICKISNLKSISIFPYTSQEATGYYSEISAVVHSCNIDIPWGIFLYPETPDAYGLFMSVADPKNPPELAQKVLNAFRDSEIDIKLLPGQGMLPDQYQIIVGPISP